MCVEWFDARTNKALDDSECASAEKRLFEINAQQWRLTSSVKVMTVAADLVVQLHIQRNVDRWQH